VIAIRKYFGELFPFGFSFSLMMIFVFGQSMKPEAMQFFPGHKAPIFVKLAIFVFLSQKVIQPINERTIPD
jgi:hypothetical protein